MLLLDHGIPGKTIHPLFIREKDYNKNMKVIRASEIGSWLYCTRAWWYQRQGVPSSNQAVMDSGTLSHRQHGRTVFASSLTRLLGWLALLAGICLLIVYSLDHLF